MLTCSTMHSELHSSVREAIFQRQIAACHAHFGKQEGFIHMLCLPSLISRVYVKCFAASCGWGGALATRLAVILAARLRIAASASSASSACWWQLLQAK